MIRQLTILSLLIAICLVSVTGISRAQEPSLELGSDAWQFDLFAYLWAVNIAGSMELGPAGSDIDVEFSDLTSRLKFGAFLFFQARKDHWSLMTDIEYLSISDESTLPIGPPPPTPSSAKLDLKLLMWDLGAAYAVDDEAMWAPLVGGQYVSMEPGLEIENLGSFGETFTWIEPYLGLKFQVNEGRWYGSLRGDVGGFGIGSDLYWHFLTLAGYQFANHWSTNVAYRVKSFDYEDSDKDFKFKAEVAGWQVGIAYHF